MTNWGHIAVRRVNAVSYVKNLTDHAKMGQNLLTLYNARKKILYWMEVAGELAYVSQNWRNTHTTTKILATRVQNVVVRLRR